MDEPLDTIEKVDLREFSSAQAHSSVPIDIHLNRQPARNRFLSIVLKSVLAVVLIAALLAGAVYFALSQGAISSDRVRGQVESQLSSLMGEGYSARIGELQVAFGNNGFFSLDAKNVRILEQDHINLGVAGELVVSIKALPLLSGQVVANKISLSNASIALEPFLAENQAPIASRWPASADFNKWLGSIAATLEHLTSSFDRAGLEEISMLNTKLIGFEALGLRSRSARLVELKIEKNPRFQKGIFLKALVEGDHANWELTGNWRENESGEHILALKLNGFDLQEFMGSKTVDKGDVFFLDNPVTVEFTAPFDAANQPQQAVVSVELGEGNVKLGKDHLSHLVSGKLNLRFLPQKNQIELEKSPFVFSSVKTELIGGVRFPRAAPAQGAENPERPLFEIIANDVLSQAMLAKSEPVRAAVKINGWVDAENRSLHATELSLHTESGSLTGKGSLGLGGETPALDLDLAIKKMSVNEFKQLWPMFLAPGARNWAMDGITDGTITDAWVKARIPAGILGNIDAGKKLTPDHVSARIPVSGAIVTLPDGLPAISSTLGVVDYGGMETTITLKSGAALLAGNRKIDAFDGQLTLGDYSLKSTPSSLRLNLKGTASAFAQLGTYKSLNYSAALGAKPKDFNGAVSGKVNAKFGLEDGGGVSKLKWDADIKLANLSSSVPVRGYKLSNANLRVIAKPGIAKINGTSKLDGIPVKLALVSHFGKGAARDTSSITLSLDEKARRSMGIDTGGVLEGIVDVTVTDIGKGKQHVVADFRRSKISFPWIEWSKGRNISATASFDLLRVKKQLQLTKLKLRGAGFGASGKLTVDAAGLVRADLKNVSLNKNDDFDVVARKTSGGAIDVVVNARVYDGRAIIKAFMEHNDSGSSVQSRNKVTLNVKIGRLLGFGSQHLTNVEIKYVQQYGKVKNAKATGLTVNKGPVKFSMRPTEGGMRTTLLSSNGGAVLLFLDIYSKLQGGSINVDLLRQTNSKFFTGRLEAKKFHLLDEPRLGKLLRPPLKDKLFNKENGLILKRASKVDLRRAAINVASANVKMGKGFLSVSDGRMRGGDAGATFEGVVYNSANRMNIKGTFLPAYGLNKFVSKIPLLGLALGNGQKRGLIGITFKLNGAYNRPNLAVNPISLLTPGVFRKLFEF